MQQANKEPRRPMAAIFDEERDKGHRRRRRMELTTAVTCGGRRITLRDRKHQGVEIVKGYAPSETVEERIACLA
jgi:hypothetical protein